jgi:hypothetical protein
LSIGFGAIEGDRPGVDAAGTVLLIADTPAGDFDEFNVSIRRDLLRNEGGAVDISSTGHTVDLLSLREPVELFGVSEESAAAYSRIELAVSAIEMVRRDPGTGQVVEAVALELPEPLELNPHVNLVVSPGRMRMLRLGVEAARTVELDAGQCDGAPLPPLILSETGVGAERLPLDDGESGRQRPRTRLAAGTAVSIDMAGRLFVLMPAELPLSPTGFFVQAGMETAIFLVDAAGVAAWTGFGSLRSGRRVIVQGHAGEDGRFHAGRIVLFDAGDDD